MAVVLMEPAAAAEALEKALDPARKYTIADAAAASGIPLRDAETGLHALSAKYRGHLAATDQGELVFTFPHRFTQPWRTRGAVARMAGAVWDGIATVARFVVRAWVGIVLVAYVAVFVALLVLLLVGALRGSKSSSSSSSGSSGSRSRSGGSGFAFHLIGDLFRAVFDSFFWLSHPGARHASPRRVSAPRDKSRKKKDPFYVRVDRFFFGPGEAEVDPKEREKDILAFVRRHRGRIGVGDVMSITGAPRDEAEALLSQLLLDYEGEVEVSDDGGIFYRFSSVRRTAERDRKEDRVVAPVWSTPRALPPLTGNDIADDVAIAALNGFNLVMSWVAMGAGLTLARVAELASGTAPYRPVAELPIALGVVPFVFSIALFALPLGRAVWRRFQASGVARDNGRNALLREVLVRTKRGKRVDVGVLSEAYREAAGREPTPVEIRKEILRLGGDVDVADEEGELYRFPDLELEAKALEEARAVDEVGEVDAGKVVFSSDR